MGAMDITVEVCGMAGDGTIAAGGLINEAVSAGGFSVLGFDSYPAEIRGFGRCVTRSRIGDEDILALEDQSDVLISLDDVQSLSRVPFLKPDASVFFDSNPPDYVPEARSLPAKLHPGTKLFAMPFSDLAIASAGSSRGRNLTALGGFAAVFGFPKEIFHGVITKKFASKGSKVLEANLRSFDAGYAHAREAFADRLQEVAARPSGGTASDKILLSGNVAVGMAAIDAGLKLYFGYPITPATPIMEYLAAKLPAAGGRLVQMEDEIASIAAVLGAFHAGARAMTATSGPGLALMTELITHGVMAEIPAVIVDAQRGGPSTGLPTKTEQSDLHAAVFGGPGDSCRIVLAPANVAECYSMTVKAFQLAERYQTPVIVLTDFHLNNRVENLVKPHASPADLEDGTTLPPEDARGAYRRYEITDSGVSPRALPGMEGFNYTATGLEHSPEGTPNYTPEVHEAMTAKRYRKIQGALVDLEPPEEVSPGGPLDVGVITWGSTWGAAKEAVIQAMKRGRRVGALKISALRPLHDDRIRAFIDRCKEILIPELNYEGQLANLIGGLHGKDVTRLNRVTGSPMPPSLIFGAVERMIHKDDR
jgi:2-oxoglutarate ferredoxin oxidoreductase subunit alpha